MSDSPKERHSRAMLWEHRKSVRKLVWEHWAETIEAQVCKVPNSR